VSCAMVPFRSRSASQQLSPAVEGTRPRYFIDRVNTASWLVGSESWYNKKLDQEVLGEKRQD